MKTRTFRFGVVLAIALPSLLSVASPAWAADSDGDGMPNAWEKANGLKPRVKDAGGDLDKDTLANLQEYRLGTKANVADSDGDGVKDAAEDADSDGLTNGEEINTYKTKPKSKDSDGDTIRDGDEVHTYDTNPLEMDTDEDGLDDDFEVLDCNPPETTTPDEDLETCTDPNNPDTDSDGLSDGGEDYWFLDPNDPHSNGDPAVLDGDADYDEDGVPNKDDELDDSDPCEVDAESIECEESLGDEEDYEEE